MENIQTKLDIYREKLLDNLSHNIINDDIHNEVIDQSLYMAPPGKIR